MATTSTTSSASPNFVTALGAGSGMDVKSLAVNLVAAEKAPQQALLDKKIASAKAEITGYGGMMFVLSEFKKTVAKLDDATDFAGLTVKNTQPAAFDLVTSASALPSQHDITINKVARSQRSLTAAGYADKNTSVISGSDFTLSLTTGTGSPVSITVPSNSTLEGVKDAINAASAGLTAQVIDSGVAGATDRYKIMVTGQPGASNSFTMTSSIAGLGFDTDPLTTLQKSTNAEVVVDGITYNRSSNTVTDIVPGVTLNLMTPTTGAASIQLARDTSAMKTNVQDLITAFNDVQSFLKTATDPKSADPDFGKTLAGNTAVKSINATLKQMLFGTASGTGNTHVRGLRDLGVKMQDDGTLTLDDKTFNTNSAAYYNEAATMLSGSTGLSNEFGVARKGVATELSSWLTKTMSASGVMLQNSQSSEKKVTAYQAQLVTLETRMKSLLARYNKQFSTMEALVGKSKSMQTSLTSTFEGMMKSYTK
jgi:flagellar hook-associated protein 2